MAAYSSASGHFVTVSEKDRPSSREREAMSLSLWMRPNSRRLWNDTTFNRALHQARPAENFKGGGWVKPLLETSSDCLYVHSAAWHQHI